MMPPSQYGSKLREMEMEEQQQKHEVAKAAAIAAKITAKKYRLQAALIQCATQNSPYLLNQTSSPRISPSALNQSTPPEPSIRSEPVPFTLNQPTRPERVHSEHSTLTLSTVHSMSPL